MGSSPIFRAINFENRLVGKATKNLSLVYTEVWCNGNTKDFDSFIVGSSPATSANSGNSTRSLKTIRVGGRMASNSHLGP